MGFKFREYGTYEVVFAIKCIMFSFLIGHNDCDEDSKVAVIEQTGKNKCTRTALAALLKKKRRKKKRKRDMSLLVAGQSPPTNELTETNKALCNSTQEEERSPQVIEETDTSLAQPLTMVTMIL